MSERGSIFPLLAGYLALILIASLGTTTVISAEILGVRVQGMVDAAVLAGHESAQFRGQINERVLQSEVKKFLSQAPSVEQLQIESVAFSSTENVSKVTICARWFDPLTVLTGQAAIVCRSAEAKSFPVS